MANIRNNNTFYIDTQYSAPADELAIKGIKVYYIIYTTSNATNQLVLSDSNGQAKISIKNVNSGDSKIFRFEELPLVFPNGIRPTTVTACTATLVIDEVRG